MIIMLVLILVIILILPLAFKPVEEQIELFLFVMGAIAVSISGTWDLKLFFEMLIDPLKITAAVLVAGFIFMYFSKAISNGAFALLGKTGTKVFVFLLVVILGLISSLITAIISALVLTEIVKHLKLPRKDEVKLVILACFSIGLGAALTPIGEPLSTITISKLSTPPYSAGFWFLFKHMWMFVVPGIFALGFAAMGLENKKKEILFDRHDIPSAENETAVSVLLRTGKVYVFIMGLVLLGKGFEPLITAYVSKIPFYSIYWINILSAVLDNATLAAAEINPLMSIMQIKSAVLGLIIAGGMLIPGNIPNIIASGKLKIKSKEWAAFALPLGMGLMVMYFVIIMVLSSIK